MGDESLKIKMDYAESSEILRTSRKMKGAPRRIGLRDDEGLTSPPGCHRLIKESGTV